MKLSELIHKVDRSEINTSFANIDDFTTLLDMHYIFGACDAFDKRIKKHWLHSWMCTDTFVGLAVYYMDDAPVAVSLQPARKRSESIEFVSVEAASKMREFLRSLTDVYSSTPPIADLDQEMGIGSTIPYADQLLVDSVLYDGQPATVVKRYGLRHELPVDMWRKVDIQTALGEVLTVDLDEVTIPYRLAH